ncbi:crossover junction endodeoxyribonuclease RuvC [Actinomycetota bacterium]
MRVLGVDPGLTRCGIGVVEGRPGRATMVAVGVVRTPHGTDTGERLLYLQTELDAWIDRFEPDAIAVERVFATNNVLTAMGTAQASALPMLAAARRGLPLALHTPTEVKAAVTGSGRADKQQVTAMVQRILGLAEAPRPADAADALALGICHLWRGGADAARAAAAAGTTTQTGASRLQQAAAAERARLKALRAGQP